MSKVKNLEEKVRKECPAVITDWMKELAEFNINAYDVQSYMHRDLANLMERISAYPGGALHLITAATFTRLSSELGRNEFMMKVSGEWRGKIGIPNKNNSFFIMDVYSY